RGGARTAHPARSTGRRWPPRSIPCPSSYPPRATEGTRGTPATVGSPFARLSHATRQGSLGSAMDSEIRPVTEADDVAYYDAMDRAFGHRFSHDDLDLVRSITERDRTLAAFDGSDIVGTAGAFSLTLTVPGGGDPAMAGITAVGVLPSHRRRGI